MIFTLLLLTIAIAAIVVIVWLDPLVSIGHRVDDFIRVTPTVVYTPD